MNNMNNMDESAIKINKLYNDLTYYDLYGGSVIIFIILIIILFLVYSYTSIMVNVQELKNNWTVERCNPKVMPFAGFINKPEGSTMIKFTEDNFNYCMQNILTSITGTAVEPITFVTSGLTSLFGDIADSLNSVRTIVSNVRTSISAIAKEIMGRILNIMAPIQLMIISFVDLMGKIKGIFTASIYTSLGTYYAMKSLLGAILEFVVIILMILAGLIVGLWILPFTWPAAVTGTTIFLSISIPLLIIIDFMSRVLHIKINSPIPALPSPGHCFHKDTSLLMMDGSYKTIENVEIGDTLANNNVITAKLKLDATNVVMYKLGNLLVSGEHQVKYKNKWICVKNHPNSWPILEYTVPYIYCINTSLKTIIIGEFVFSDWDEIFEEEAMELLSHLDSNQTSDIHKFYDGGFYFDTKVELENGEPREISKLEIGTVLKGGSRVDGLVEILGENLAQSNEKMSYCGINVNPIFPEKKLDLEKATEYKKNGKLYHLIIDKKFFFVGNTKFYHYNSCIELFLEKDRRKLLSMKYV